MIMAKIKDFALTYRLYFLPVVYFTVLFGFIAAGHGISARDYFFFALIALSAHLFGFGVNDWSDLEFDKQNPRHWRRSMLVRGELSLTWHQFITLIQFPLLVGWAFILDAELESFVLVAISIILLTIYNLAGKKAGSWVILVDLCFPLSLVFLFLSGYSLQNTVFEIPTSVILLMISIFLSLFIANSVQGGFRDMAADLKQNASNFLGVTGSRMVHNERMVAKRTKILSFTVYLANLPIILWQCYLAGSPWWYYLMAVVLIGYGFMDLVVMLHLKSTDGLKTTDYYVATAYIFYAALLPWMTLLPNFLWAVIIINLLYPLVVYRKTHFGRQTFSEFLNCLKRTGS